jgi:hypothetical protein
LERAKLRLVFQEKGLRKIKTNRRRNWYYPLSPLPRKLKSVLYIKCPHAFQGCSFSCNLETSSLSEHLVVCPYESLKDYISCNNAKVALLAEKNIVLRHRLETAENTVQVLKRDMSLVKGILGPWLKGTSQDPNPGLSPLGDETDRRVAESPGMDGDSMHVSSSFGSHQGFGGGFYRIPAVAPLDIEDTIQGTMVALRKSIVDLAGAIDAIGRRGEMALANETLRLGEEIMSIRAQIHGLRMQVHGVLMERNAMAEGLRFGPSNITKL